MDSQNPLPARPSGLPDFAEDVAPAEGARLSGSEDFTSSEVDQARLLTHIGARIYSKIDDYARYQFSFLQTQCLNIFFDLAQELDEFEELCALTVMLPEILFNIPVELFLLDPTGAVLVRQTPGYGPASSPPVRDDLAAGVREEAGFLRVPVQGRADYQQSLPFKPLKGSLGMLVFHTAQTLSPQDRLFYQKYANRVGFQLHNRLLVMKNKDHLRFINNLVHDIGHNVIVPNMYFKLLFHQLEGKIHDLSQVRKRLEGAVGGGGADLASAVQQLGTLQDLLEDQYAEVYKYFLQSSLFLETLLRQSHFEQGHYVLQKSIVNLSKRVLEPQMERYRSQLEERGIEARLECPTVVEAPADVGLISQVVANLLSNAVKYTRPSPQNGEKFVICSCARVQDAFGPGKDGICIEVLSSGPHIDPKEAPNLFKPDFRASNAQEEYGTGHGLYFTCEIITRHGGIYGYKAVPSGNAFHFTLPLDWDPADAEA